MKTNISIVNGNKTSLSATVGSKSVLNTQNNAKTNIQPAVQGIKGDRGERGPAGVSNIIDIREFILESFDGQDQIDFPEGHIYTPGKNSVFVYIDGIYLDKSKYVEFSNTVLKFVTPLASNKHIVVKYIRYEDFENIDNNNGIIISDLKPVLNVYDGLLWFDMVSATLHIYSSLTGFKELSYKTDFTSADAIVFMDGGTF